MRQARLKVHGEPATYHCLARLIQGQFLLGPREKEHLVHLLHKGAYFAGVKLLTYVAMSNHYHMLVRVEPVPFLSDAELVDRVEHFYGPVRARHLERQLLFDPPDSDEGKRVRQSLLRRMGDISEFVRLVHQHFSVWYNRTREKPAFGTIWADRFKSTLVEPVCGTLEKAAAYVDLNPVRAGLCEDPKDYRWCGYAEAVAGGQTAREGLGGVILDAEQDWTSVQARYRLLLFGVGERGQERKGRMMGSIDSAKVQAVVDAGGELDWMDVVRCRVRYFTDGMVIGSKDYVERIFQMAKERGWFGAKRTSGARSMVGGAACWGGLHVMRDLRRSPIQVHDLGGL